MNRPAMINGAIWIKTAKDTLIEEGLDGVKIDRLAKRLGVTRGGFYHHFVDRDDLLVQLLAHWEQHCHFLPEDRPRGRPADAAAWFDRLTEALLQGDGYDPRFDLAVREWGRSDQRVAWAVERADRERMRGLYKFFRTLGYEEPEAHLRACVFYYHQIGYIAIGVRGSYEERRRRLHFYLEILCGNGVLAAARAGHLVQTSSSGA